MIARLGAAIAIVAILNFMVLTGIIGWLLATERIDVDRLDEVWGVLEEPIPLQQARLEREAEAMEAGEDETQGDGLPVSAEMMLEIRLAEQEEHQQRIARMQREIEDLGRTLGRERRELDDEREAFEAERDAFEAMRTELAAIEGDEQFRTAVGVLQNLKADEARAVLAELIEGNASTLDTGAADGITQAVSYLNAMSGRARGKIMREFTEEDPALAADLLERLRVFGLENAAAPEQ
ncbi:MAG: hypothetical protein AAF747_00460 [Planctomycetota bacterium]